MRIDKNSFLLNCPIAHRGLWNSDIAENSAAAYINAAEKGYAIEIDLYGSKDGEIVVFHDKTLDRLTGEQGYIWDRTLAELKELSLYGGAKIPTLEETLEICCFKAPLLIEFKDQPNNKYLEKAVDTLKQYKGEFAVQAFNPLLLNNIRRRAPEFIRGILAAKQITNENLITKSVVKNMSFNFLCKPDFISYEYHGFPLKKSKVKDKVTLAWTVTSQKILDSVKPYCDNIIFENFIPNL